MQGNSSLLTNPRSVDYAFYEAATNQSNLLSKFHKTIRSGVRRVQVYAQTNQ